MPVKWIVFFRTVSYITITPGLLWTSLISSVVASQFQVICGNDGITVLAHRSSLPKSTNVNGLHLLDRRCRANYNQTHIFIKTSLTGCGTRYKETDQKVFFSNALSEEPSSFASKDVITRSHLLNVNFTCSYGRKRTVGSFSFQPARQRLSVSLSKWEFVHQLIK